MYASVTMDAPTQRGATRKSNACAGNLACRKPKRLALAIGSIAS
jgi:hypothetical protein